MSTNLENIKKQAQNLTVKEKADLAHELITSLDDELDADVESQWDKEIAKRVNDIKSGKATGRPAQEILAEIRANFS